MRRWMLAGAVLGWLAACGGVPTASAKPEDETLADGSLIELNFPESTEVKMLVDYVSKRLGLNILYDRSLVQKKITISAHTRVPKESLLGLLKSVLKATGLALVDGDQPGWKQIVEGKDLVGISERIQEDTADLEEAEATVPIMQMFPLRHADAQFMTDRIKPFLSKPGGNSFAIEKWDLLVVTDYADHLRRVAQVIEMFDRPGPKAEIHFVDVEHWDASELVNRVTTLLRDKRRVSGAAEAMADCTVASEARTNQIVVVAVEGAETEVLDLIETLDQPTEDVTCTYRFAYVSPGRIDRLVKDFLGLDPRRAKYRATVDEEAGLLVVTAPPRVHAEIESLKEDLDEPVTEELRHVRFYKLLNASASEVLATIRAMEGSEGGLGGLALESEKGQPERRTWQQLGPGPNRPPGMPGPGVEPPKPPAYTPSEAEEKAGEEEAFRDESSRGPEFGNPTGNITRTSNAVVTVDENTNTLIVVAPPPVQQIYKELIQVLDKRRPQVMVEVTMVTIDFTEGLSLGIELSGSNQRDGQQWITFSSFGLSTVNAATGALNLNPGTGFNGILVDPQTADVVLRALATHGRAKVLSSPRILVNDNATGTLSSVAESPFTSVNASDTVATTSFAGYASAGTTVAVTPQISEDDYLRLTYSLTLNSFTGAGAQGIPPPRQTDTVDSEVVVPDGYTVIVGGLRRRDISETVQKIPVLGDIPGLKHLFRNVTLSDTESTLFVFIRPTILRDDEFLDLKYLSDWELRQAELPPEMPEGEPMLMR